MKRVITKINVVKDGSLLITFNDDKKVLISYQQLLTYKLREIAFTIGATLDTEDSVHPVTAEVSETWCRISG